MVYVWQKFSNGSDTGPAVRAANGLLGIKTVFVCPDGPNAAHCRSRIDQDSVEIKQHTFALNFVHCEMIAAARCETKKWNQRRRGMRGIDAFTLRVRLDRRNTTSSSHPAQWTA